MEKIDLKKGFDIEKMDETSVKTIEAIEKSLNDGLEDMKKGLSYEESFKKVNDAIDELKSMNATKELTDRIEAIEKKMIELNAQKTGEKTMSKTAKFEETFKSHISTDVKGNKVIDFKSALRNGQVMMELDKKDATTIMGNGVSTRVDVDKEIAQTPVYRPWIFDVANVRKVTAPTVMYVDKTAPKGTPAFVTEGGVKPLISWEYEPKTVNVKKVAVAAKFTTEVATDIDGFMSDLKNELTSQVKATTEYEILNGNGESGSLVGVVSSMPGYTLTTIKVANPNTYDAIVAAATQIKSSSYGAYTPTHVVLNPQDVANMRLTKNSNGDYLINLAVDNNPLSIKVIESAQRAVGSLLIGDFSRLNIDVYVEMALIFGFENDDIRRNMMTTVAESRMATYIKDAEKYAFVSDTIDNITTAIKKA